MKLSHVFAALLAALVVHLAGMLLFSTYNAQAYDELLAHAERLERNVEQLRATQRELVAKAELYRRSSDAVAVEARRLQYYGPDQEVVRLTDREARSETRSPGTIVRRPSEPPDRRSYIRLGAVIAFVLALLAQLLADPASPRRSHEMRRASR
jgi:cell division protein FtsB